MIIGYARVSTEDQDLKLQHDALNKFGVERIISEKASGKTVNRVMFQSLLKYGLRSGDTLVVWKLDRLGRTLSGVVQVIEDMEKNGVELVSITDGFDVRTPMGKAMMQISLVFAELERNLISERTKAGMEAARAAGKTFGPKNKIRDFPKRMAALIKMDEAGELRSDDGRLIPTDKALLEVLNKADPKAPKIESLETVRRWRRAGMPGLDT